MTRAPSSQAHLLSVQGLRVLSRAQQVAVPWCQVGSKKSGSDRGLAGSPPGAAAGGGGLRPLNMSGHLGEAGQALLGAVLTRTGPDGQPRFREGGSWARPLRLGLGPGCPPPCREPPVGPGEERAPCVPVGPWADSGRVGISTRHRCCLEGSAVPCWRRGPAPIPTGRLCSGLPRGPWCGAALETAWVCGGLSALGRLGVGIDGEVGVPVPLLFSGLGARAGGGRQGESPGTPCWQDGVCLHLLRC